MIIFFTFWPYFHSLLWHTLYKHAYQISKEYVHVCRIHSKYKCALFSCSNSLMAAIFNFPFEPNFFYTSCCHTKQHVHSIWKQKDSFCRHHGAEEANVSFLHFLIRFLPIFFPMACTYWGFPEISPGRIHGSKGSHKLKIVFENKTMVLFWGGLIYGKYRYYLNY